MRQDFERYWLGKFSACVERAAGSDIREKVMEGSEDLSDSTDRNKVVEWSARAMALLDEHVAADKRVEIMTGCACQYPKEELLEIRKKYEETEDIDLVLDMLQEKFVSFLRDGLNLDADVIEDTIRKEWGLAGRRDGNKIIATKIPKSGYIAEYLEETDPVKKRAIYCHCPRIRDALEAGANISPTYCCCGAGYYRGIWEEILQKPVRVELLKSVLKGDDVCSIAVHLP
jgi:predicted hydrocarbon binding protein